MGVSQKLIKYLNMLTLSEYGGVVEVKQKQDKLFAKQIQSLLFCFLTIGFIYEMLTKVCRLIAGN